MVSNLRFVRLKEDIAAGACVELTTCDCGREGETLEGYRAVFRRREGVLVLGG